MKYTVRTALILCLYGVNAFAPTLKNTRTSYFKTTVYMNTIDFPHDDEQKENTDKPKQKENTDKPKQPIYKYSDIPSKLCASDEETKIIEKNVENNYSEQWVATLGNDWWNYPFYYEEQL
tara:strand:+ start:153 stop:512 length:360 start_codon:yes stop_codon:yes gene_type:complete